MPRRRRSFSRLFICLPLIAVLGIWVFSYGRCDSREFVTTNARYLIASTDGHVQIWHDEIEHSGPIARPGKYQHFNVPYWAIWAVTAAATLFIQTRIRHRNSIPGR